ncbi:MAG: DNA polymerase I [Acidimicrobiales bacterium]
MAILALDGNNLAYRAFFALPTDMATASGQVTNAVFGFTSMLVNLLRDHRPEGIAVAFDLPAPTFRHSLVADYKAGRAEAPDILRQQLGLVRKVVEALRIPALEAPGYEADDILATLATAGRDRGQPVIVVTGDRDCYQLVEDPLVKVLYNRRGVSDYVMYDEAGIFARCGVTPAQYPEYAALRGDTSDNLPGVPGVGEKTAARLIAQFGGLDGIFANVEGLSPKLAANLVAHEAQVRANASAIVLVRDVPLDMSVEELRMGGWDREEVRQLFAFLEFRSLWDRLLDAVGGDGSGAGGPSAGGSAAAPAGELVEVEVVVPAGVEAALAALEALEAPPGAPGAPPPQLGVAPPLLGEALGEAPEAPPGEALGDPSGELGRDSDSGSSKSFQVRGQAPAERGLAPAERGLAPAGRGQAPALAVEPSWAGLPGRSALSGLALLGEGRPSALWLDAAMVKEPGVLGGLANLLAGGNVEVQAHGAKELMRALLPLGVDIDNLGVDTSLAAYLLDPSGATYPLAELAVRYAGLDIGAGAASVPGPGPGGGHGTGGAGQLDLGPSSTSESEVAHEAARRAVALLRLAPAMRSALAARSLTKLYEEVERPLARVLARMELVGVGVDVAYLRGLVASLTEEAHRLDSEVQELAGEPFLVNSTTQLRRILFDKLGLTPQKRTKTGYSTDAASLERLRGTHEIIDVLLRYREVEKLRSTYGESLLAEVGRDGRIHASFNQTVARTGRLSSETPNLHNIPVRSDEGRRFRRAFIPAEGHVLAVADYNQIELRVIAHLASDPGLIEAFASGTDVHTTTAARVFGAEASDVTPAQRAKAKMVSYGLAYGMESYGLAQRLGIGLPEAEGILAAFFEAFPNVRSYMERTVAEARDRGYTETLFGRRRAIPELSSRNYRIRQAGERQAMNAGIQGLAADIFKVALVRLDAALVGMSSQLILQVHDEVILDVPPGEEETVAAITREAMEGAAELSVPLEVNLSWGATWADAKG